MPAPVIYYIRHGETSWNAEGRLQGVQDIPLNELGRSQAAHAGNILADLFARDGRDKSSAGVYRQSADPRPRHHGAGAH